jgi:hypothetical protein
MNKEPQPYVGPPPYYEKFVSLAKCEAEPTQPTSKIYLKGRLFYDSVEDNSNYDYTWAFVRVDSIAQPIKIRGLPYMNRAYDLDEVYI